MSDETIDDGIAYLSFAQQRQMACCNDGWLQGRYHSADGDLVRDLLSFNSVFEICPIEIGVNRSGERRAFASRLKRVSVLLELKELMQRAFVSLSNGEMRRVLFARAILKAPKTLVLEDPLAGLDAVQRHRFRNAIAALARSGVDVRIIGDDGGNSSDDANWTPRLSLAQSRSPRTTKPVVEMSGLSLRFGRRWLFRDFSWRVMQGERWILKGRNGSGKTTLLALITGDSPLAYAHDIKVFGQPREPGHELSRIRRRIGMVGAEMQTYLGKSPEALLDSALAAKPALLLLDEPCMNLSPSAARKLCRRVSVWLASHPDPTAICVAHRPEHVPAGFDHVLDLDLSSRVRGS